MSLSILHSIVRRGVALCAATLLFAILLCMLGAGESGPLRPATLVAQPAPLEHVAQVSGGYLHTCALMTFGAVKCWGGNEFGQLGIPTTTVVSLTPVNVTGLNSGVVAISAGDFFTCAVLENGTVKCWGRNDKGQLGNGGNANSSTPVDVDGTNIRNVTKISAGSDHVCAVGAAILWCWGNGGSGQLGSGSTDNWSTPYGNPFGIDSTYGVGAGGAHTCALLQANSPNDRELYCTGVNQYGQLGRTASAPKLSLERVEDDFGGADAVVAGEEHTCAMDTSYVQCWGRNNVGQLGNGLNADSAIAVSAGFTQNVQQVDAGGWHTCALAGGAVSCWGLNGSGQLGDNTNSNSSLPVAVQGLAPGVLAIGLGRDHSCAVTSTHGVKCWGSNTAGKLGDGTVTSRSQAATVLAGEPSTLPLSVAKTGSGEGTVVSDPAGINCGSTCSANFSPLITATLTANALDGSQFTGWTGCASTNGNLCIVTMDGAKNVTATFTLMYQLVVTFVGEGGEVTFTPNAPACRDSCARLFPAGTEVTLHAEPDLHFELDYWQGDCTVTVDGDCVASLTSDRYVTMSFARTVRSVTTSHNVGGKIGADGNYGQESCSGNTCTYPINSGEQLILTAQPAAGHHFVAWGGDCAGTSGNVCTLSVTANKSASATFAIDTHNVTITEPQNGVIALDGDGEHLTCPKACINTFDYGTVVTLTAAPDAKYRLAGWSGECAGAGIQPTCVLTVTSSVAVGADFALINRPLSPEDIQLIGNSLTLGEPPIVVGVFTVTASFEGDDDYVWSLGDDIEASNAVGDDDSNQYFALDSASGVLSLVDASINAGQHSIRISVEDGRGSELNLTFGVEVLPEGTVPAGGNVWLPAVLR